MSKQPIQLTATNEVGQKQNVYPYTTAEYVHFDDNKTLADKLNNIGNAHIHSKASATQDGFMSKEDFVKLTGLINYSHPSTHAATMITQDSTHRFITDTERVAWNEKASSAEATIAQKGLLSPTDKQKIDSIDNNFNIVYDSDTETINFRFK